MNPFQMSNKTTNSAKAYLIIPIALFFLLTLHYQNNYSNPNSFYYSASSLSLLPHHRNMEGTRPIMYTFFELKKRKNGEKAQKENEFHQLMLQAWSDAWYEAGWEPRVLTLKDAKQHPDFYKYSRKIIRFDKYLFAESYNYMCLVRWLAMAAQGKGGWMSDYDTFPVGKLGNTNIDGYYLPNYGVFTSHERWVPSLMSASASEWNKMALKIMDMAVLKIQHEQIKFYSDMLALQDLHLQDPTLYIQELNVRNYPYKQSGQVDCDITKNLFAVHLSHASTDEKLQNGVLTMPDDVDWEYYRPIFAKELIDRWRQQCVPQDFKKIVA